MRVFLNTATTMTLNIKSDWAQNHSLVVNGASVSLALFMTFYAGCFISASFAGAIGKSIRQVAIPILIYRSQQERKKASQATLFCPASVTTVKLKYNMYIPSLLIHI